MQVVAFVFVIMCAIPYGSSQGHRGGFPPRGPPRPPPYPGFVKKWQQLQKMHLRGPPPQMRPHSIPMHSLSQKPKKPYPPTNLHRYFQSTPPVRPFWNSPPSTTYRPPTEQPKYVQPTEKYTYVLPNQKQLLSKQKEYDFHIQTNQIPSGISSTLLNPIQQVGEKGPIHTIPAPNLSPADRPANIEHVRPKPQQQYVFEPEQQFQHEYHVTEASESVKYFRNQQQAQQNVQYYSHNIPAPAPTAQPPKQNSNQNQVQYESQNGHNIHFESQNGAVENQENPSEYYQVVQNAQQGNSDDDEIPHHKFLQNIPNLELLMSEDNQKSKEQATQHGHQGHQHHQLLISEVTHQQQPQQQGKYNIHPLFAADQRFVEEFQRLQNQEKPTTINLNPDFQSFNYNEQDYQKQLSKSSLVSAGYNLDYEPEASEIVRQTISRSTVDSQEAKDNFNANDDNLASNDVEPNVSSNAETAPAGDAEEAGEFFSSLPNKEVADALASLQAAGKINSNLMKLSNRGGNREKPVEIYVTEVTDDSKPEDVYILQDYEQLGNDEEEGTEALNAAFGAKIKPKRN